MLRAHPWVEHVELCRDDTAIRVRPAAETLAVRPEPGALIAEHLDQWGEVYDLTYAQGTERHRADLDLSGWRASDTGEPYPVEHMTDWLRHTVDVVRSARPRRVLELGCGTGMLLHRLLPQLDGYVGTDVSAESVRALSDSAPDGTRIVRAAAHEVLGSGVAEALTDAGFPSGRPDCVLINSVTQCFPDVSYLRAVVQDALRLVEPGGTVIVGDVRHSGLLHEHHRWLAGAAVSDSAVSDSVVADRAARDEELLFDPVLLAGIASGLREEVGEVELAVHAKTMRADTELTRYRFDAVLRVGGEHHEPPHAVEWTTLDAAREHLAAGPGVVTGIPNALLRPGGATAAELRERLSAVVTLDPYDPRLLEAATPGPRTWRATDLSGDGRAHEPFAAFVRRRLTELARRELRRAGVPSVPVDVAIGESDVE
ncbi:hypothetical protein BJF85_17900 [Saccharomonospora sp. CUA-673]|nr:hypothetical protein BJF85_17900 [Saccharomonospora sp. CUA-673]